jgi:hypothetical protein
LRFLPIARFPAGGPALEIDHDTRLARRARQGVRLRGWTPRQRPAVRLAVDAQPHPSQKAAYWVPFGAYYCTANSVGCDHSRNGEPMVARNAQFYYKVADGFDAKHASRNPDGSMGPVQWPPENFRMITGHANATTAPPGLTAGGGMRFECYTGTEDVPITHGFYDHIPTGAEAAADGGCTEINFDIAFPRCWDGANLDSANHVDHLRHDDPDPMYQEYLHGCIYAEFPIAFPSIQLNIHYFLKPEDLPYFRFTSDPPCFNDGGPAGTGTCGGIANNGQPGGWTGHADWWNGWSTDVNFNGWGMRVTDAILKECYGLALGDISSDCHNHGLGSPLKDNHWYTLWLRVPPEVVTFP